MDKNFMLYASNRVEFIRCVPVLRQRWVTEGFTMKTKNYDKDVKAIFNMPKLITAKQVHGDTIIRVQGTGSKVQKLEADALITNALGVPIGVRVADCVGTVLVDTKNKAVGAVHSGWRGIQNMILLKTLGVMKAEFNTKPEDLIAVMSASIMPCCYEVGEEVYGPMKNDKMFKGVFKKSGKKFVMDMKQGNLNMLLSAGVKKENIYINDECTQCDKKFYSYRREGKETGRHVAFVMINK